MMLFNICIFLLLRDYGDKPTIVVEEDWENITVNFVMDKSDKLHSKRIICWRKDLFGDLQPWAYISDSDNEYNLGIYQGRPAIWYNYTVPNFDWAQPNKTKQTVLRILTTDKASILEWNYSPNARWKDAPPHIIGGFKPIDEE